MKKEDFKNLIKTNPFFNLGDAVYDFLVEDIITMKLPPNQRISESHIANELCISRSPVKMAIDKLIEEKLISKHDNKSLNISNVDPQDYLKICQARIAIEGNAAFLAATHINDDELRELDLLTKEYKLALSSPNMTNFEVVDHKFHSIIVSSSHNSYLIEMYNTIQSRILRYRYYIRLRLGENDLISLLKDDPKRHHAIFTAIKSGYSSVAKTEIEFHIDGMRDILVR